MPSRATLSNYLAQHGLEGDFGDYLWLPVSRAHNNDLDSPMARYFVIHDTSGPNYGHHPFPDDIDESPKLNDLQRFYCPDGLAKAHVFISRTGELLVGHDYSVAWRETKFEQAAEFGNALLGLFLHNELIQPRQSAPGHGGRNDARTPDPAFTAAQYDRLALVYVIASVRAERWLVPAFHAAIDAQALNGHDDPLNFDIEVRQEPGQPDYDIGKARPGSSLSPIALPRADKTTRQLPQVPATGPMRNYREGTVIIAMRLFVKSKSLQGHPAKFHWIVYATLGKPDHHLRNSCSCRVFADSQTESVTS